VLPIVTAEEMRGIDKATIESIGIPGVVLMENAGRAVVRCVESLLQERDSPEGPVVVLCGGGNNGGDGYVVARVLMEHGCQVQLFAAAAVAGLQGDARVHAEAFLACGGVAEALLTTSDLQDASSALSNAGVLVDALFGTGLDRIVAGHWRDIIECVNASAAAVVAVDIPSGLRCDDGRTMGIAVQADATVTFGSAKVAQVGAPGFASCGTLHIAEIGIPQRLARDLAEIGLLQAEDIRAVLASDPANAHKGSRGHVLAVAGSAGKQGAGRLVGLAALRAGAGLVTLAAETPDTAAEDPLMTAALKDSSDLQGLLPGKSALVLGPGMDSRSKARDLVLKSLSECELPQVLDADALNHLGHDLAPVAAAKGAVVLTPHPGEAGRLLEMSSAEVQADRIFAVRALAKRSGAIVVLKGARTCICDGRRDGRFVAINPTGGPELGTAGTGDVLAGTIAALLARGVEPLLAAWTAVYWHGEAGRVATLALGGPGMVSSDLLAALPRARAELVGT
jgi:NAD(P)H-hydrate epimerase